MYEHPEDRREDADERRFNLSKRQLECLAHCAKGLTSAQIAAQLGLSVRTVDHYIAAACAKLGVSNRIQAVAVVITQRLIPT